MHYQEWHKKRKHMLMYYDLLLTSKLNLCLQKYFVYYNMTLIISIILNIKLHLPVCTSESLAVKSI